MPKLKIAIYWAAGCGGCDVAVLDVHERILKIAELADILLWPMALDFKYKHVEAMPDGHIDVCFLNGAIRNSENEHLARLLRRKSKVMVAFGSCAYMGGIPGLANFFVRREILQHVYIDTASTVNPDKTVPVEKTSVHCGDLTLPQYHQRLKSLAQVVPTDYFLPGCPPNVDRVWEVVEAIVSGKLPPAGSVVGASDVALCDECPRLKGEKRLRQFKSVATFAPDPDKCLLEQGVVCCGPATRGGCGYRCIKANMPCRGCYGPAPGVVDQGAKMLSAIASVVDSEDPSEVERIVGGLQDPGGTFYRFGLATSVLGGVHRKETA